MTDSGQASVWPPQTPGRQRARGPGVRCLIIIITITRGLIFLVSRLGRCSGEERWFTESIFRAYQVTNKRTDNTIVLTLVLQLFCLLRSPEQPQTGGGVSEIFPQTEAEERHPCEPNRLRAQAGRHDNAPFQRGYPRLQHHHRPQCLPQPQHDPQHPTLLLQV